MFYQKTDYFTSVGAPSANRGLLVEPRSSFAEATEDEEGLGGLRHSSPFDTTQGNYLQP